MKTSLYHLQLNVSDSKKTLPFYKNLLSYFEYEVFDESGEHLGASNGTTDLWIIETEKEHKEKVFNRKNTGINHLAFRVNSREQVDEFSKEFLEKNNISRFYDSPKLFPEYTKDYYAVYFEDPDRIKLEVVFTSD